MRNELHQKKYELVIFYKYNHKKFGRSNISSHFIDEVYKIMIVSFKMLLAIETIEKYIFIVVS